MADKTSRDVSGVTARINQASNPSVGKPAPGMENQDWSSMVKQADQNKVIKSALAARAGKGGMQGQPAASIDPVGVPGGGGKDHPFLSHNEKDNCGGM